MKSGRWSKKTKEDLRYLFGKHVLPIIGAQPPREVTLTSLQLLLNKLAEDGYCKSGVGQIRTYLKACFEYAADEDLIEKNPTRKLDMPNIRKKSCERFLTVDELRTLLSQAAPREHVVLRILAVCGLRAAEILVLRIEDFEGMQLRIDEALKERQSGKDRIGTTKNAESDNYVPVPPDLAREIRAWIAGHPDRDIRKRNGRSGLTRQLQLTERTTILPREYTEDELARFFASADDRERELFTTFLFTGFREQEMVFLFWSDVNLKLRTIRVISKPSLGFFPKRWEEREVPVPAHVAEMLEARPRGVTEGFVFASPTGRHEQNMLLKCKSVAARAGLDPTKFDLKTFRSTYSTRMLRAGFDVRTVQQWMGHKTLQTTMRYLVPASDVHDRLDRVMAPGRRWVAGQSECSTDYDIR